jgi:hypothetical protein
MRRQLLEESDHDWCPGKQRSARFSAAQPPAGGVTDKPRYNPVRGLPGALPANAWTTDKRTNVT